jgi:hypothetical protein
MIHYTIVWLMIGSNTFGASQTTLSVNMKVRSYTTQTSVIRRGSVVFSAATVGAISSNASGLVYTSTTVLMLVAMLAAFAGAREPFETKLIFSNLHILS